MGKAWRKLDLKGEPFNLAETLGSGQAFHWTSHGEGYVGVIGAAPVYLEEREGALRYLGPIEISQLRRYLGLDQPIAPIYSTFPAEDPYLKAAMSYAPGLRILRQPHWECLATFITSSMKQVIHIRQISFRLRERFGCGCEFSGLSCYAYPTPESLALAGEVVLRECGLGYRAKSLAMAAERVASGSIDLKALESLDDETLREALMSLHGVGEKIANCVMLFAYGRLAAFPVDVWVERVLRRWYSRPDSDRKWTQREMQSFARDHFGPYAGYAQQYLFHYARRNDRLLFGGK